MATQKDRAALLAELAFIDTTGGNGTTGTNHKAFIENLLASIAVVLDEPEIFEGLTEYIPANIYNEGNVTLFVGKIYQANEDGITGAFDISKWTEVPANGSLSAFALWENGDTYVIDDIRRFQNRLWISLQNGNQGNTPTTSPTFWDEVSPTQGVPTLNPWIAGVYNAGTLAIRNDKLYRLNSGAPAFNSVDIDAEITNSDWIEISTVGTGLSGLTQNFVQKANVTGDNLLDSNIYDDGVTVVIGGTTSDASVSLNLEATDKGFLKNKLTSTQRNSLAAPPKGLEIFNTTTNQPEVNTGTSGSPIWTPMVSVASTLTLDDVMGNGSVASISGPISIESTVNGITLIANVSSGVIIQGLIYPNSDGSAGQVIKTDGAGNLTFEDESVQGGENLQETLDNGSGASITTNFQVVTTADITLTADGAVNITSTGGTMTMGADIVNITSDTAELTVGAATQLNLTAGESVVIQSGPVGNIQLITTDGALLLPIINDADNDITTPIEGLLLYQDSTNKVRFYNGSTWVSLTDDGSITLQTVINNGQSASNSNSIQLTSSGNSIDLTGETGINFGVNAAGDIVMSISDGQLVVPKFADPVNDITTLVEGGLFYDTTDKKLQFYNGTIVITLPGAGTGADLSVINVTATNITVASDSGTNAVLPTATGSLAGVMPGADKAKLNFITVTQAVDLDSMESDIATNNAKVSNVTHTGEVTGSGALTVDKTAITGKTTVTGVAGDFVLISDTSDSGNLKKVDITAFLVGGDGNGIFDAANDGGTVPAGFDVNITDTLKFISGKVGFGSGVASVGNVSIRGSGAAAITSLDISHVATTGTQKGAQIIIAGASTRNIGLNITASNATTNEAINIGAGDFNMSDGQARMGIGTAPASTARVKAGITPGFAGARVFEAISSNTALTNYGFHAQFTTSNSGDNIGGYFNVTNGGAGQALGVWVDNGITRLDGPLDHRGSTLGFYTNTLVTQASAISKPSAGSTIDTEARAAIDSIIDAIGASLGVGLTA